MTSTANDLSDRLRKRLESERREIEELTASELKRQRSDRAATKMFLRFFGRDRRPETLSRRDWDRFIRARRTGKIGPSGRPVSDRTIECDLKFLIAVFNWAAKSRDDVGRLLLGSNPLKGLKTPTEKNPVRVVLLEEEYHALLGVSRKLSECQPLPRWRIRDLPPLRQGQAGSHRGPGID